MIIGNNSITNFLEKSFEGGTLAHAYIFNGPSGIGKKTTAKWLSKKLLNTEKLENHPDFIELETESNIIKKENIDWVIEKARLSSFLGGYKVILIDDAHNMNRSSANAFLKTLEEPPKKTIIILLTSEIGKMLPTIKSRSSILNFKSVKDEVIAKFLTETYNASDSMMYAKLSYGRPGVAIKMLEDNNQGSVRSDIEEFYDLFFSQDKNKIKIAKSILCEKSKNKELLAGKIEFWLSLIRNILFFKYNFTEQIVYVNDIELLEKISKAQSVKYFGTMAKRLINMKSLLKNNINPSLMLENLVI